MQFGRGEKRTEVGSEEGTEVELFRTGHTYPHTHARARTNTITILIGTHTLHKLVTKRIP